MCRVATTCVDIVDNVDIYNSHRSGGVRQGAQEVPQDAEEAGDGVEVGDHLGCQQGG